MEERPDWDEYFLKLIEAIGSRATCNRGYSGAVIVRDNTILTSGYVGSPMGTPHCEDIGHLFMNKSIEGGEVKQHCIRTAHAEQNAIIQAAREGIRIKSSTLYCKMEPCYTCAKMIVNAGIIRVVCQRQYHDAELTRELFKQVGTRLDVKEKEVEEY